MKNAITQIAGLVLLALTLLVGCGGGSQNKNAQSSTKAVTQQQSDGLTAFEQEHGIGPVTEEVELEPIDMEKVKKGQELFKIKCSACHKIEERYIGPALGTVLKDRSPTYVMNMIMNPNGMVKKHPEAKKMLAEFLSPMPNQNLERDEVRAIVEYLASVQAESTTNN